MAWVVLRWRAVQFCELVCFGKTDCIAWEKECYFFRDNGLEATQM